MWKESVFVQKKFQVTVFQHSTRSCSCGIQRNWSRDSPIAHRVPRRLGPSLLSRQGEEKHVYHEILAIRNDLLPCCPPASERKQAVRRLSELGVVPAKDSYTFRDWAAPTQVTHRFKKYREIKANYLLSFQTVDIECTC